MLRHRRLCEPWQPAATSRIQQWLPAAARCACGLVGSPAAVPDSHDVQHPELPPRPALAHCTIAEPSKPKTKAAAKNAKRKEKKLAEQAASGAAGGSSGAADAAAAAVQKLSLGGGGGDAAAAAAAPAAAPAAEEPPSVEKQIRNLKKKMRQAEALAEKRTGGAALSLEEEAKLSKLPAWQEELAALEAQL